MVPTATPLERKIRVINRFKIDDEIRGRFGPFPISLRTLITVMRYRVAALAAFHR